MRAGSVRAPSPAPSTRREEPDASEKLIDAAAQLLANRPPSAISTREIAAMAGVQQSLIFRHFGTKDGLMRQVALRYMQAYLDAVVSAHGPIDGFHRAFDYLVSPEGRASLVVLAFLPGEGPATWPTERPGVDQHVRQMEAVAGGQGRDLHLVASMAIALMAGWSFLERWALSNGRLAGLGIDDARAQLHEALERMVCVEGDLHTTPTVD